MQKISYFVILDTKHPQWIFKDLKLFSMIAGTCVCIYVMKGLRGRVVPGHIA